MGFSPTVVQYRVVIDILKVSMTVSAIHVWGILMQINILARVPSSQKGCQGRPSPEGRAKLMQRVQPTSLQKTLNAMRVEAHKQGRCPGVFGNENE